MRPTPSSLGATSAGGTSRTSALLPPPSGFEVYDIGNNNITNAAFIRTIGLEWQFAGIAPVHGPGASDLVLRNVNSGACEVYDIANNH